MSQSSRQLEPIDQTLADFMKLLPFDAAQSAYRKAAIALHPDKGGSMDSMSKLNVLWTKASEGSVQTMSDLLKPNKVSVRQAGGLHSRLTENEMKKTVCPILSPNEMPNRIMLLIDFSGSMGGEKIRNTELAAQDFVTKMDNTTTSMGLLSFPTQYLNVPLSTDKTMLWFMCSGFKTPGDTTLREALVKAKESSLTRGIIISDGEPTDLSIDQVRDYLGWYMEKKIPLDTVHIGDSESRRDDAENDCRVDWWYLYQVHGYKGTQRSFHWLLPEHREQLRLNPGSHNRERER